MVKENNNSFKPVTPDNSGQNEYTEEMHQCIRDYANEFMAVKITFAGGGMHDVHEILQEYKLKTFDEYLDEKSKIPNNLSSMTKEEYDHPTVQSKTKELSDIAREFNAKGPTMDEETYKRLIERVTEIIDTKNA